MTDQTDRAARIAGGDAANGIAAAVLDWVEQAPNALAVIDGAARLTRADLRQWCLGVAAAIRHIAPDSPADAPLLCALLLPRSWAVPFGLIAARLAGLAFLLLDPADPPERSATVLRKARPAAVLVPHANAKDVRRLLDAPGEDVPIAPPDAALSPLALLALPDARRLPVETGHVVFTSGSSGAPKGVLLRDAPLLRTAAEQRALLGLAAGAGAASAPSLWALSPGFDASLSDIFCAILGPAPLFVFRPSQTRWRAVAAAIADHGIARADLAPSLLRVVPPKALGLAAVIFGGERCDPATAARWGEATLALQAYGPTEAAVCAMIARAGPGWREGLLGRPLAHQIVLLQTDAGLFRVVPAHPDAGPGNEAAFNATRLELFQDGPAPPAGAVVGEIWLAGAAIAIGYLDAPVAEAARFGRIGTLPVHRSGDVARWSDGALVWLGRADRQFKLHGRRIAPEEIEAIAGAAWNAACVCSEWRGGLALALEPAAGTTTSEAVIAAVNRATGIVPRAAIALEKWPKLSSGKTDPAGVTALFRRQIDGAA